MNRRPAHPDFCRSSRSAFSLIELLVVIGILGLLIGLLGVVFSGAFRNAREAATSQYLGNIGFAIEQFKTDFNYYPPLIDDGLHSPEAQPDASDLDEELRENRYASIYTLPLYLIGIGDLDGFADPDDEGLDDGVTGAGFRDPGIDRSWGGALERDDHRASRAGRTYGPYMDIGSGDSIRNATLSDRVNLLTESDHDIDETRISRLYVFRDRWDNPIRYYRRWPTRDPANRQNRWLGGAPIELFNAETLKNLGAAEELAPDVDRDLLNASGSFALLSAGSGGVFADAPIGRDALPENYNLLDELATLIPGSMPSAEESRTWRLLIESLDDNVRFTP